MYSSFRVLRYILAFVLFPAVAMGEVGGFFYDLQGDPVPLPLCDSLILIRHSADYIDSAGYPYARKVSALEDDFPFEEIPGDFVLYGLEEGHSLDSTMEALRQLDEVEIVNPVFMPEPGHPVYATNQFLVEPYPWVTQAMIDSLNSIYHVDIIDDNPVLQIGYVLGITAETLMDVVVVAQRYYESGFFLCAEANLLSRPFHAFTPNDPIFADQWYLNNDGQGGGVAGADIAISQAWDITVGNYHVVIAIIDNGFGLAHEDLSGTGTVAPMNAAGHRIQDSLPTTDVTPWCVGYDPPYYLSCIHGTVVSGVAFARTNNGMGMAGIAPNCRLMPIRDTDDWGWTDIATLERAFFHTYQGPYRADIIACSWYWPSSTKLELALQRAYDSGLLIFFSSGNQGNMTFPSYTPWVISVGATNHRDSIAYFSG